MTRPLIAATLLLVLAVTACSNPTPTPQPTAVPTADATPAPKATAGPTAIAETPAAATPTARAKQAATPENTPETSDATGTNLSQPQERNPAATPGDAGRQQPSTPQEDMAKLSANNNAFAFDLYHALTADDESKDGNLFYSPYSISSALAMTYAGARGDTEAQMAEALRLFIPQDPLHPAFNALHHRLTRQPENATSGDNFTLNIANAVWGQQGHPFAEDFSRTLSDHYGAGIRTADFNADPEASRNTINDWVADSTEGRITGLIPEGIINSLTRMVLTNAIYFKAAWLTQFLPADTRKEPFTLLDGSVIQVSTMSTEEQFAYARGEGFQAVNLPYVGNAATMTILLPDQGRFQEFEDGMDQETAARIIREMTFQQLHLKLPKFRFESKLMLSETLRSMGVTEAFDPGSANFSGMDGRSCKAGDEECLFIQEAVHKAHVSVDEEGTEAAAATAVIMGIESEKPEPINLFIDRPFIFLIRHNDTGAILFMGRVLKP